MSSNKTPDGLPEDFTGDDDHVQFGDTNRFSDVEQGHNFTDVDEFFKYLDSLWKKKKDDEDSSS